MDSTFRVFRPRSHVAMEPDPKTFLALHPAGAGHAMRETGGERCGMLDRASAQRSGFLWCYEPVSYVAVRFRR